MNDITTYVVLAILCLVTFVKGIIPGATTLHSDFVNYYVSAKLVVDNEPLDQLYDNQWFQQKIKDYQIDTPGKFSPFPPITALIMIPLTIFDALTAQRVMVVINLISLAACILLIRTILGWKLIQSTLLVLAGGLSVLNNIAFGQIYIVITAFILFAFWLHQKNYFVGAGIIFGFFAALKYFPLVFLLGYLLSGLIDFRNQASADSSIKLGSLKVALSGFATILILTILQYVFFGSSVMSEFLHETFLPHLNGELRDQGLYSFHYQSWDNLFRNIFLYDPLLNTNPFVHWPLGRIISKIIIYIIVSGSMLIALHRFKNAKQSVRLISYLAIISLASFVLLPATATYHFALVLFPVALTIGWNLMNKQATIIFIIIYILIGFIPYGIFFNLGKSVGLLFGYPRLWLITSAYVILILGMLKKHKLNYIS